MKINKERDASCTDIEVTVRYPHEDKRVHQILSFLHSVDMQIPCENDGVERMVSAAEIYYIESVDKRTFIYLKKAVYRTDYRLYQLMEDLRDYGFVQISKSCILNINVLDCIKPLLNSRMEATLKNGEKVYINRNYLRDVKRALGGDDEK